MYFSRSNSLTNIGMIIVDSELKFVMLNVSKLEYFNTSYVRAVIV